MERPQTSAAESTAVIRRDHKRQMQQDLLRHYGLYNIRRHPADSDLTTSASRYQLRYPREPDPDSAGMEALGSVMTSEEKRCEEYHDRPPRCAVIASCYDLCSHSRGMQWRVGG